MKKARLFSIVIMQVARRHQQAAEHHGTAGSQQPSASIPPKNGVM